MFDASFGGVASKPVQNYSRLLLRFLEWLPSWGIASIHLLTPGALDLFLYASQLHSSVDWLLLEGERKHRLLLGQFFISVAIAIGVILYWNGDGSYADKR